MTRCPLRRRDVRYAFRMHGGRAPSIVFFGCSIPAPWKTADCRSPTTVSPARPPGPTPLPAIRFWYKDAVIYQLHVKAFFDSNEDGIGDFQGLASKLDYIQDLGVNAIWVMPFYPSPLKDDGYDVADYLNIHPQYGTAAGLPRFPSRGAPPGAARDHRARRQPHVRPARLVPGGTACVARHVEARFLRLERQRPEVSRHTDHFYRYRSLQLDVGPGRQGLLLAPLLQPPARPQLRQPERAESRVPRHALLARHGCRRLSSRRHSVPAGARGHEQRKPSGNARGHQEDSRRDRREVRGAPAPRRGQPVARGRARLLRRRRRMSHGVPLSADAAHVHGDRPGGPSSSHRDHAADARHPRRTASGRSSCATTTS